MNSILRPYLSYLIAICVIGQTYGQCPPVNPLSFSFTTTTSTCEANGTIQITAQDGELPYSYEIIAGPVVYPIQSASLFPALPNGNYIIEVSDGCGTVLCDTATVSGDYAIPTFTVGAVNPYCPSALNGQINGAAANGLPPFEYRLIRMTTTPDTIGPQSTGLFAGLGEGDYRIQVFDQCNNFQTRDILLQDPALGGYNAIFYSSTSTNQTMCGHLLMNASAQTLNPRFPNTFTVKNSTGTIIHSGQMNRSDTLLGMPAYGNYTFVITDACGRSDTQSNPIVPRAFPTYGFNCDSLGVRVNVSHMIPPYTYEILTGPESRPLQTSNFFGNLTQGVYTIQVIDACSTPAIANVDVDPEPWSVSVFSKPSDACSIGFSRFWPGSGSGNPQYPLTYELLSAPAGVPLVSYTGHPTGLNDLPQGSYTIKVTDACGVMKTISGSITSTLQLSYTVSTQTGCQTGDILVTGSYTNPSGGKVRLERLDGSIARPYVAPIGSFYNLVPDTFVLAFNSNEPGCSNYLLRDTIILPEASQPQLDLLTGIECVDQTATITGFPVDGVAPYTFEIISGPELRGPQTISIFSDLPFGTYDVRMVDACSNSFVNSVSIEPFLPQLNGYTPPVCMGDSLSLYVDNIYGASYNWTGPNGFTADTFIVHIAALSPQDTGTYTVHVDLPGCVNTTLSFDLVAARCGVVIDLNLLLEGPFQSSNNLMTDNLRTSLLLPSQEPYTGLGYQHFGTGGGESVLPGTFDTAGADAIVDWVFLELRDSIDVSQVVATRAALLQADGNIVDMDGISAVIFDDIDDGNYYVIVRHRNHLDIATSNALPLTENSAYSYDFTTGMSYGSPGYPSQKNLGGGLFALYECDFNQSGIIDASDRSIAWNYRNQTGYLVKDSNFDGVCNAAERSQCWNNRNLISKMP